MTVSDPTANASATVARWRGCWAAPLHLAVTHGPDAGWLAAVGPGDAVLIGRSNEAALRIADPRIEARHAVVTGAAGAGAEDATRQRSADRGVASARVRAVAGSRVRLLRAPRHRGRTPTSGAERGDPRTPRGRGRLLGRGTGHPMAGPMRRTITVGHRRARVLRPGDTLLLGDSRIELRHPPAPVPESAGVGHAPAPRPNRRSGLALLPLFLLVPLLTRSLTGGQRILVLAGLAAVGVGVALVVWWARRGRGDPLGTHARPVPAPESGCDPATFAAWVAGVGTPPGGSAERGGPIPGDGSSAGNLLGPGPGAVAVHDGLAHAPPLLITHGVAIAGRHAAGLARWLRCQLPDDRPVHRATSRAALPPGPWVVLTPEARLGVSAAWVAAIEHASSGAEGSPALLEMLGPLVAADTGASEAGGREGGGNGAAIARAWLTSGPDPTRGLAVPLAVTASGREVLALDLVEHGPHALVAGTTGSGKSELLGAWALALAAHSPPAELTLLLVDFKGGATFGAAAGLPHCVGLLTDLDAAGATRALAALRHELRRRERLLAEAGVRDRATLLARGGRLARLVVMVDELRALVEDDADRLGDLVAVATLGRSLGIHLVLATQRPAGVVSGQLRSNLALRICLRVTDPGDSTDVVGHPGAARSLAAGTGFVTGASGHPPEREVRFAWLPGADAVELAGRITSAARRTDRARRSDLLAVTRPWLPPLPARASRSRTPGVLLLDRPEELRHEPWTWPGGALLVSGPSGSGRTTALRAAAGEAMRRGVGVHVVSREGWRVPAMPGTHLPSWDVSRLLRLLTALVDGEDPDAGLVLDDVELAVSALDAATRPGIGLELVTALLQRRSSWCAISTDAGHRWSRFAEHHLVLGLHDGVPATLSGVPRALVDAAAPRGRGVLLRPGDPVLAQVVEDDVPATGATGTTGATGATRAGPGTALRLSPLPHVVPGPLRPPVPPPRPGPQRPSGSVAVGVPLGIGGDDAAVLTRDLVPGQPWLVAGPHGSGRTTALRAIAHALSRAGVGTVEIGRDGAIGAIGAIADEDRPVLIVDDAELLAADQSERVVAALTGRCVVATTPSALAGTFRGVVGAVREARTVLALGGFVPPQVDPRRVARTSGPPGRALLVEDGRATPLQLPMA